eukprot:TRINITY_DN5429_c1_g4_i8.p1 TRINITY_DN5429_c1_g4~~TRINITY_DN5429_c1_g4_i8.p1  ORF type:complete len:391 (-),score=50.44 TRINITY_DN5429_c1_g4_i8:139-1311(-)
MDPGSRECVFSKVALLIQNVPDHLVHREYLGFAEEYKFTARELTYWIGEINNISSNIRQTLTSQSISQWIFCTNKIESAGFPTLEETNQFLDSRQFPSEKREQEVSYVYQLLEKTNDPRRQLSHGIFDTKKLLEWHRILGMGLDADSEPVLPSPGSFRRVGVCVYVQDEEFNGQRAHNFPHHEVVSTFIEKLERVLHSLGKQITKYEYIEEHRRVLYTFALAAFAQFHFVDIHPFQDGNGRICRFLSKFILDGVCPFPFPMFPPEEKTNYFHTLINGRNLKDAKKAPSLLLELMIDTAIKYYREIAMKNHPQCSDVIYLCGEDSSYIVNRLGKYGIYLSDDEKEKIEKFFSSLLPDTEADTGTIIIRGTTRLRMKRIAGDEDYLSLLDDL